MSHLSHKIASNSAISPMPASLFFIVVLVVLFNFLLTVCEDYPLFISGCGVLSAVKKWSFGGIMRLLKVGGAGTFYMFNMYLMSGLSQY